MNKSLPGVIRPAANASRWAKKRHRRTAQEKRETVVRGIERSLRGEPGAPRLERFDPEEGGPVIRVLYASHPLPIFDGRTAAVIEPGCDREALWQAVIDRVRSGACDREIVATAARVYASIARKRLKAA